MLRSLQRAPAAPLIVPSMRMYTAANRYVTTPNTAMPSWNSLLARQPAAARALVESGTLERAQPLCPAPPPHMGQPSQAGSRVSNATTLPSSSPAYTHPPAMTGCQ